MRRHAELSALLPRAVLLRVVGLCPAVRAEERSVARTACRRRPMVRRTWHRRDASPQLRNRCRRRTGMERARVRDCRTRSAATTADGDALMPVITISRMYGSGGSEVAERVARALGWALFDNAMIDA